MTVPFASHTIRVLSATHLSLCKAVFDRSGKTVTPCQYDGDMDVAYSEEKFVEMVLHVADRLQGDRAGGATKLNKVLFFAEFTHLRRHHQVISGCEFQKLNHGPAPRQLLPVRDRLIESGEANLVKEDFLGRPATPFGA